MVTSQRNKEKNRPGKPCYVTLVAEEMHEKDAPVGDVIFAPNGTISAQKRTDASWAAIRSAHRISKKTKQGTKGNTSGLIHRRLYANVAAARA